MKAWLVVHDYLPQHVGGTELCTQRLAHGLAELGHEVTVLSTERDLAQREGTLVEREHAGVRVIELVHQREYPDVRSTWTEPLALRAFTQLLARERPDVVHFQHFAHWGSACLTAARRAGIPTLLTLHDYHLLCDNGFLLRPTQDGFEPCTAGATAHATCGECLRRHPIRAGESVETLARERREWHARQLAGQRGVMCPSRFLLETFAASGLFARDALELMPHAALGPVRAPRRSDPAQPLRIAYVGGLYPQKGVHVLLEALQRLHPARFRLRVHGVLEWFPEYVARLRELARGLPVEFCGRFAPEALDELLQDADVLCVPSLWYENMPLVVLDAYRNGVPVVASRIGGLAEAVTEGRGGLGFTPGDAAALAKSLERLAADRDLLFALACGRPEPVPFADHIAHIARAYEREP